ncbi:hypothetical protein RB2150_05593 [Rhodobacterales bacterium HTCC2150]|nr:hypothetical protein RB2150_05593 [Rhodobacterales bacterium HTCC2150] [Rhodobacteraceae bacterium HTCC2150]
MQLYGLKNCDTCKKALKTLVAADISVEYFDVRADGVPVAELKEFLKFFGDKLVNTRSTTWRGLSDNERAKPQLALLQENPTLMKRPVIRHDGALFLGWTADVQQSLLGDQA